MMDADVSFGSNANIMASVGDECGFGFGLGGTFRRIYNGFGMLDIDLFLLTSFFWFSELERKVFS